MSNFHGIHRGQPSRRGPIRVHMVGMAHAAPMTLGSLLLAVLAPACASPKCGEGINDRCFIPGTESDSATTVTPTGPTSESSPTTSDATTGTPGGLMRCTPTCTADADCTLEGMAIGFACVEGACGLPPCVDDIGCQLFFSGWSEPCTKTAECFMGEACIDIGGGEGRCATQPGRSFKCADFGLIDLMKPALEGGALIVVCGDTDAVCKDDACLRPCQTDEDCSADQGTPHCQPDMGQCTCTTDTECQATLQPGFNACIDGRCGCSSDADCASGTNVDVCVAGSCGCSSTAACTDPIFDHVTQICEPA